jgi:transposase
MAKELTPRQQEIKALTEKGLNAPKIAKKLDITENAVYQHLRAIRGGAKKSSGGNRRGSGSTARSRKRATSRRQSARTSTPAAPAAPATAEELLTAEIAAAQEAKATALTNIEELKAQITAHEAAIQGHDAEIATKTDVLDVLTGKKVAQAKPKPRVRRQARLCAARRRRPGSPAARTAGRPRAARRRPHRPRRTAGPLRRPHRPARPSARRPPTTTVRPRPRPRRPIRAPVAA